MSFHGKQTVAKNAEEIVKQLHLTRENIELFEDCERIALEVISQAFPSYKGGEILDLCRYVHSLHETVYRDRFPKYLEAAEDVFGKIPVKDDVKGAITKYHQLEQLVNKMEEKELESIKDPKIREVIKAVKTVHENNLAKRTKLKELYGLRY